MTWIITTTSAQGRKILDIEMVKPGCVICDVSRPFDIQEEDALKRPDVMVIASGEVQLPGNIDSKVDLGLEGNVVYACLAENSSSWHLMAHLKTLPFQEILIIKKF